MRKHTLNDNEIGVALKKDVILGGWIGFLIGLGLLGAGMDDQFGNIEWGISIMVSNLKTIPIPLLYGYISGNMLEASLSPPISKWRIIISYNKLLLYLILKLKRERILTLIIRQVHF